MKHINGNRFFVIVKNSKMFGGILYYGDISGCSMEKIPSNTKSNVEKVMRRYPQRAYILKLNIGVEIC